MFFNTNQGDNIRLVVNYISQDYNFLADKLHADLQRYLNLIEIDTEDEKYAGNEFFMNFPNNSTQYNLFELIDSYEALEVQSLISQRIVEVFSEDAFDEVNVFTFSYYIFLTLCRGWSEYYCSNVQSKIYNELKNNEFLSTEGASSAYINFFAENRQLLMEVYEEIYQEDITDNYPLNLLSLKQDYKYQLQNAGDNFIFRTTFCLPFDKSIAELLNVDEGFLNHLYKIIYQCSIGRNDLD